MRILIKNGNEENPFMPIGEAVRKALGVSGERVSYLPEYKLPLSVAIVQSN
jgi:hypothetical protein